uniref:Uncharacterized protein n=1 Tax=Anguilla anguilla TaxID=7936 RepID=A0A0E9S2D0_ANGAN
MHFTGDMCIAISSFL